MLVVRDSQWRVTRGCLMVSGLNAGYVSNVLLYFGVADRLQGHATENRGSNVSPRSRRNVNVLPDPQGRVSS